MKSIHSYKLFFSQVLRRAFLGILVGIGIHIAFNVSVVLANSCAFTEEALRIKIKTTNISDEKVTFPTCALVQGSQHDWVDEGEGQIQDYRYAETTREAFSLIYRIEAAQ